VRFAVDAPLGPAGAVARGHEFHYSTIDPVPDAVPRVWRLEGRHGGDRAEGYLVGRSLMTYVHLHFASNPDLPRAFVEACAAARRLVVLAAGLAALWLTAAPVAALTLVDMLGREVTLPAAPRRIVSLVPSATELIFALGGEDRLVGRTDYCDYPPAAKDKPSV